jgi:hypothetical protein
MIPGSLYGGALPIIARQADNAVHAISELVLP